MVEYIPLTTEERQKCFTLEAIEKAKEYIWNNISEANRNLLCITANTPRLMPSDLEELSVRWIYNS